MITVQSIAPFNPSVNSCEQGKGYPDLATRQLVKFLSDHLPPTYALSRIEILPAYFGCLPSVPFVALVDGDAYGLDIVSVYKFGSLALRHEASKLAALRVECIGVWASELASQVSRPSINVDMCSQEPGSGSTGMH